MRYPVTYTRLLARELRLDVAGQAQLLAGTGLTPADLGEMERLISAADQLAIIRNALALAGRPTLGLEIGSRLSLAAHGPLGQLLSAGPTLGDAWAALERFHALRLPLMQLSRRVEQGQMVICLSLQHEPDAAGLFLVEATMVTVQRGIELHIGRRLREATLQFSYPAPAHVDAYARYLHGRCEFAAGETALRIPLALMEQANPFRDARVWEQALHQCELLEQSLADASRASWQQRITHLLQQHPGQLWTLATVAAHFHLSPRTLMRHLKQEGTSYQSVLDQELSRQALLHLRSPRHTTESVALALGYQDATAFRRAFRRWFGMPPSEYLARHPGQ